MNNEKRSLICSYLEKYLNLKFPTIEIKKDKLFICPFSSEHTDDSNQPTCKIYPSHGYKLKCLHESHSMNEGWLGDIFSIVKKVEPEMKELDDIDIGEYLIHLLDIQTDDEAQKTLAVYANSGFKLIPLQPNSKNPIEGVSWFKTMSDRLEQWQEWYNANLNLGLVLGKVSSVVAIDIDHPETFEKIKHLLGDTAIQTTSRGHHYLYNYDHEWMEGINHVNFRNKGYEMELRANNAYIVVSPSSVSGEKRTWNGNKIQKMSPELKEFLISLIDKPKETTEEAEKFDNTTLKGDLTGLEGRCNDFFVQMGGILRKKLPPKQTEYALLTFNKALKEPMPYSDIKRMMYQISKYNNYDKKELADEVFNHLKVVEQSTARDLQASLGYEKKDIEEVLQYLISEGKVLKSRSVYKAIKIVEWDENFISINKPLPFKVPYFDDIARFSDGSMIIIGSASGRGKCIANGLIATNRGFVDIRNIGKYRPDGVSSISSQLRIYSGNSKEKNYRKPNYFYKEKINHTIKIQTYYGFELEGTPEHPILTIDKNGHKKFTELQHLSINDNALIVIPDLYAKYHTHKNRKLIGMMESKFTSNKINKWNYSQDMNSYLAKLSGYIIGDGSIEKNCVKIYQNNLDKNCIKEIQSLCKNLCLPCKTTIKKNMTFLTIYSVDFVYFCKVKLFHKQPETKYCNLKSPERFIPTCILQSTKEEQIAFIEALFNCESSLTRTKRGGILQITMASKLLIDTLQMMLLNFGIISRKTLKKVKRYPNNNYWTLSLCEKSTFDFFNILNPIKYLKHNIKGYYQNNLKIKWIGNNQHIKNKQFRDKIIKIEHKHLEQYVYDFNIESKHYKTNNQFWSNGFVSHNTHVGCNFIKRFVDQGICPYLICTEADSKFGLISASLGLKVGDFKFKLVPDPSTIELEDNSVTIIDWLSAGSVDGGDYAKTEQMYKRFEEQLVKHKGLLIIFAQLKKETNSFYAETMSSFYASLMAKYCWSPIKNAKGEIYDYDSNNTYFKTEKIRDSKLNKQFITIPTYFDSDKKTIELRKK